MNLEFAFSFFISFFEVVIEFLATPLQSLLFLLETLSECFNVLLVCEMELRDLVAEFDFDLLHLELPLNFFYFQFVIGLAALGVVGYLGGVSVVLLANFGLKVKVLFQLGVPLLQLKKLLLTFELLLFEVQNLFVIKVFSIFGVIL